MKRRRTIAALVACALLVTVALAWPAIRRHARAASLLTRLQRGEAPEVDSRELRFDGLRARRYAGERDGAPVVVLVHGVHPDGIDEPRLVRFAKALASSGLVVVTPELPALAGAHLDPRGSRMLADACDAIARHEQRRSLGVVGISFGGGLAILAATRSDAIGAILAIGAHHDAASLARSWLGAAGSRERYGLQVLAHAYAGEYLEGVPDPEAAQAALAALLREERPSSALSPEARARVEPLRHGHELAPVVPRLQAIVDAHADELAALSPAGQIARVDVPVFLLHGLEDPLIASTESQRIQRELPPRARGGLLRTPLIGHADPLEVSLLDQLEVVRFMARVLEAFESL